MLTAKIHASQALQGQHQRGPEPVSAGNLLAVEIQPDVSESSAEPLSVVPS